MPLPKYKYIVTYNSVDREVFPLFDGEPEIEYQSQGDEIALLKKFSAKLIFINQPREGIYDYDYFLDIEANDKCALVSLSVQQLCGTSYTSIINAEFGVTDGEWDKDNCTFKVEPNATGIYANLLLGKKVNMVDSNTIYSVYAVAYCAGSSAYVAGQYQGFSKFEEMLLYIAQQTDANVNSIISNFFQINPTAITDINYVTETVNIYTEMYVSALSNIRNVSGSCATPQPSELATKELVTWRELMEDLHTLFGVFWYVDGSNNIVIEHFNKFNLSQGIDLTDARYKDYVSGTNKYAYDKKNSPRYETWSMFSSDTGCEITYDNACGNKKLNEDRIEYSTKKIFTDFYRTYYETNKISANTPGIFLMSTVNISGQITMRGTSQNEELVLSTLVQRFHRNARPQLSGELKCNQTPSNPLTENNEDLFIYSERPIKKQTEITIPFCCDDSFDSFKYQKTFMGNGVVISAKQNLNGNTLKLSLKYKINSDNVDILPTDISGLNTWLKGDAGKTVSGGRVSAWADQSGNGNDFASAANKPYDGSNYLRFNQSDATYIRSNSNTIQTFPSKRGSVFVVFKSVDLNAFDQTGDMALISLDATNSWDISLKSFTETTTSGEAWKFHTFKETLDYPVSDFMTDNLFLKYGWTNNASLGVDDNFLLFELIRDSDSAEKIYLNGKLNKNNPLSIPNVQADAGQIFIGTYGLGKYLDGDIFEVIIYDRDLTGIERQKIEQYLSKKYAMNLYHLQ